jgi:hypothetical protein
MIFTIESLLFFAKTGYPHAAHWLFIPAIPLSILAVLFIPYFIPSIVAFARRHHNAVPILFLNIFLGWTLIGWVGALIWALTTPREVSSLVAPAREIQPPAPAPAPEKRFCPNCGNQVKPTDAFCSNCGTKLS